MERKQVVCVAEIDARCNLIRWRCRSAMTKAEAEVAKQRSRAKQRLDQQVGVLQVESKGRAGLKAERGAVKACIDKEVKLRKYK